MSSKAFKLDLPPQFGIHDVENVRQLKLYETLHIEVFVPITHPKATIPDVQYPLPQDTLLDVHTRSTRHFIHSRQVVVPVSIQAAVPHLQLVTGDNLL
jgi:hypothetical protein